MKILTAEQMRDLDRRATEQYGIPSIILMENAGRAVYENAVDMLDDVFGKRIVVICGKGNNGGDGFCVARHLHNSGADVRCYLAAETAQILGDAKTNLDACLKIGIPVQEISSVEQIDMPLRHTDLIIDALLGTGIKGEVTGLAAEIIDKINSSVRPVLAVDLPSGLIADTGQTAGTCVQADRTVTFALPKIGLMVYPGAEYVGDLVVADISIPLDALEDNPSRLRLTTPEDVVKRLPARPPDSHKGTFGHLAVIAGSVGMTGAATMASESAARAGTGLVTLCCPESLNDILEVKLTEAMTVPLPETKERSFSASAVDKALEVIERCDAVAIGPGLSRNPETVQFVHELLPRITKPVVIDADALNALAENADIFVRMNVVPVITPHPGELSRLLGTDTKNVQSKRLEFSLEVAQKYRATCVLKGARTIIASPEGDAYINPTGSVALASGGSGDVLTGLIGGLLAQGLDSFDAAIAAVYVHGLAGEIAAEETGVPGAIAGDVLRALPRAFARVAH